MRFRFIAAHTHEFHVTTVCRVLAVSKAGYYAWVNRPPSERALEDAELAEAIEEIHGASRRTYGSPRVRMELRAQGQRHSAKRVARIMQEEALRAKMPRRFRVTTDSSHAYPIAPNVLDREFAVTDEVALDRVWVGDITYLTTREGWLYLAVVLDLASRRVIGWAMRHTLEGGLTRDALTMAVLGRQPAPGVLHHTDRGSQSRFNRSSQHPLTGDCDDDSEATAVGSVGSSQVAFTGTAAGWAARGSAALLGGHRPGLLSRSRSH